jgi:hypothetical protein
MMLHLRPELVDLPAGFRNVPEGLSSNRYVRFGGAVSFGWLSNDFGPSGHIGDPTGASADRGKQLFEGAVRAFGEALRGRRFDCSSSPSSAALRLALLASLGNASGVVAVRSAAHWPDAPIPALRSAPPEPPAGAGTTAGTRGGVRPTGL